MKKFCALALLAALSGCASLADTFTNRLSTTLDGKEVFVNSMYGPLGLTSKVNPADAAAIRSASLPAPAASK